MASALIKINGVVGSNTDLPINTIVNLDNQNSGGETTYLWSILDQPPGTADALSATNIQNPTLLPKKEGSYLIKLIVNQGLPSEVTNIVVAGIRQLKSRERIPAAQETVEADASRGWATHVGEFLQHVDRTIADPGVLVGIAGQAGMTQGTVVRATASAVIKSGLPGQETLPSFVPALATSVSNVDELLGVLETGVDGSPSPGNGAIIKVRIFGRFSVSVSGASAVVGEPVFVSDTGTLVRGTPGTNRRVVGSVLSVSGATFEVMFFGGVAEPAGSGGSVMGSGSNGAIAFWTGASAISADATNLFWDDTNNRLGVGTNAPTHPLDLRTAVVDAAMKITNTNAAGFSSINFMATDGTTIKGSVGFAQPSAAAGANTMFLNSGTGTDLALFTNNAVERARINSSGQTIFGHSAATLLYSGYTAQNNIHFEVSYPTATAADTPMPFIVLAKNLTGTSNFLGQIDFVNKNIADGSEKRSAIIAASTDGALNSGRMTFYTMTAGVTNERIRITSAGRVGVNTSSPTQTLDIRDTIGASNGTITLGGDQGQFFGYYTSSTDQGGGLRFNNSYNGTNDVYTRVGRAALLTWDHPNGWLIRRAASGSAGANITWTQDLHLNNSGQWGFGISPSFYFHLKASPDAQVVIDGDATGNPWVGFYQNGTQRAFVQYINAQGLVFNTAGTTRMRIDNGGNVGIGTATPTANLHVNFATSGGIFLQGSSGGSQTIQFGATNGYAVGKDGSDRFFINRDAPIGTAALRLMTILSTGQVGIGDYSAATNPAYQLDIRNASSGTTIHLRSSGTGDDGGYLISTNANQLEVAAGAAWDGTNWRAKSTTASIIDQTAGTFNWTQNTGLTIGNTFTPTTRVTMGVSGTTAFIQVGAFSQFFTDTANNTVIFQPSGGGGSIWATINTRAVQFANSLANINAGSGAHLVAFDMTDGSIYWNAISTNADIRLHRVLANAMQLTAASHTIASGNANLFITSNDSQAADLGGSIAFAGNYISTTNAVPFAYIWGRKENSTSGNELGYLAFGTRTTGTANERMRITSGGNVGINTTNPQGLLHVEGSTNGDISSRVVNPNAGASATAFMAVSNSATLTTFGVMQYFGASWAGGAPLALFSANGTAVYSNGAGGLTLGATNASGVIKFGTGGTTAASERLRIATDGGVEFSNSTAAAVSTASTGRIRYNATSQRFEISENGGAYNVISTGGLSGSGTATYIPKFTGTSAIGNSALLDDGVGDFIFDAQETTIFIAQAPTTNNGFKLSLFGGDGGPTGNTNGGDLLLSAGFKNASGIDGVINIGAGAGATASAIMLGTPAGAVTTTINGNLLLTDGASNDAFMAYAAGQSAAVSAANTGRIRYNASSQKFELSENGAAYAQISSGNFATKSASVSDLQLTTTGATSVATFTPSTQGNYVVFVAYRVTTATTNVTITVTWTDGTGSQTYDVQALSSQTVNTYSLIPLVINSTATAITVTATAGTANQVFVSASITGV